MLERARYRRQIKKLYKQAIRAGLTDLGVRMRNETARRLTTGETIVEDEPVLVGDAQSLTAASGSGLGRWGWMVLTSDRLIWAAYPERKRMEARLDDLDLVFSEDDKDTFKWTQRRERMVRKPVDEPVSVTLGFVDKSEIRPVIQAQVKDGRHGSNSE